ncbi:hypothetical protein [Variovorax sp. PvP013]|uniref:hypothetical protein n=1 Tax=Variovorax sp. PvP013 TaxID=3156435 RepID=UPI003D1CFC7F
MEGKFEGGYDKAEYKFCPLAPYALDSVACTPNLQEARSLGTAVLTSAQLEIVQADLRVVDHPGWPADRWRP